MCAGDQSLPGGLTALIKQGRERKRERRDGGRDKEGGVQSLKEERSLQCDGRCLILMPARFVSVALSRETNSRVTLSQPVMGI